MERKPSNVKTKRTYDSSRRRAQARRNREAVLDAATRRFFNEGYAMTTIAASQATPTCPSRPSTRRSAERPGSCAIYDRGLEGAGRSPRTTGQTRCASTSPMRKIIANWGVLSMEVAPGSRPSTCWRAAAGDPEMATLLDDMDEDRRQRMSLNARFLRDAGHLRRDVTLEHAADILWTYSSPELYELLVLRRGWSVKKWSQFIVQAMTDALLPSVAPSRAPRKR
jgi:hypothetical protein